MTHAIRFCQRHFLGVEALVAAVPAVALGVWFAFYGGTSFIDEFIHENRTDIYWTTAGIAGTLLGFSMTSVSLILTLMSPERPEQPEHLRILRESPAYPDLWKTFFQTIRVLGLLTITSLVCLIVDKGNAPVIWFIIPVFFFLIILSVLRLCRAVWILERIVNLNELRYKRK